MDEPFEFTLPVKNVNQPQSVPELKKYSVQVTLNHTLTHIRHSIWLFSDENRLKPGFLSFQFWGQPVEDSSKLTNLFFMIDPNDVGDDHGLCLVIDYTLYDSPIFPHRDPVPDLFDVEIKSDQNYTMENKSLCFTRESLLSSVASIKEIAATRYKISAQDVDLVYNGKRLSDSSILREVLQLDVPPLSTVKFDIKSRTMGLAVRVAHRSEMPFPRSLSITKETNIRDLKEDISRDTGEKVGHIEVYFKTRFFSKAGTADSTRISEITSLESCSDPENSPMFFYEVKSGPLTSFDKEAGDGYYSTNINVSSETSIQYALRIEHRSGYDPSFTAHVTENTSIFDLKTEISKITGASTDSLELHVRKYFFSRAGGADQTKLSDVAHLEKSPQTSPVIFYNTVSTPVTNFDKETSGEPFAAEESIPIKETLPYETYELSLHGKTVELSTSECILDPHNHILLNPSAIAKLAQIGIQTAGSYLWKENKPTYKAKNSEMTPTTTLNLDSTPSAALSNVPGSSNHGASSENLSTEVVSPASSTREIPADSEEFADINSAFASIGNVDNTNQHQPEQNEADADRLPPIADAGAQDNHELENRGGVEHPQFDLPNRVNANGNGSVILVLIDVINANRAVIFQSVLQVGLTIFFVGGGASSTLFKPAVLTILSMLCFSIAFFMLGIEISDWMNENILIHGDENSLDHAILKLISLSFRSAASLNIRISTAVSKQCVRMAKTLHQTRLERLEDEVLGNTIFTPIKRIALQVLLGCITGAATIFPFLEVEMRQFFEDIHRKEGVHLKKTIQKNLQKLDSLDNSEKVRSIIEAELRVSIEMLTDSDSKPGSSFFRMIGEDHGDDEDAKMSAARSEENEDLLRCHLMLKWFQRNQRATELPLKLRRSV